MQVLRKGSTGPDVEKWQAFLKGLHPSSSIIIDGNFGIVTEVETKAFQSKKGLVPDGTVGRKTLSVALAAGFSLMEDPSLDMNGPSWPPKPATGQMSYQDREKIFGKFSYIPSPTIGNPENITITGDWVTKNISTISIPQLQNMPGMSKSNNILVHVSIAPQMIKLFEEWHSRGLMYLVMTWGGSWSPRFIRGSRTILSNHAWGTAFDINVQWNQLGMQPALRGEVGSVRELVESAYDHGFYWGGWFPKRMDGMHFEAYKVL